MAGVMPRPISSASSGDGPGAASRGEGAAINGNGSTSSTVGPPRRANARYSARAFGPGV